MAFDLKQGIDLKELGSKIKALFAKDSNILGNKLVVFSIVSILVTLVLIYSIYEISDNQSVYDEANNNHNNTSVKLNRLETKFKKTLDGNKVYFKQLMASSKTKSELSAKVTGLVNQYNLLLKSIDLNAKVGKQNDKGVILIVSGSYLNLIRFSSEMNEILSASKLVNLAVRKPRKGNSLIMELAIIFSAPPSANALPLSPTNTVKLLNKGSIFDGFLNMLISSANASEEALPKILPVEELTDLPPLKDKTKIKGLSLFQTAHQEARSNGLIKFEFTNKAGETKVYLTGLKESEEVLVAKQAVTEVELSKILPVEELTDLPPLKDKTKIKGLSLFQTAHQEARSNGLIKFEFTNKAGETKVYLTGLKEPEEVLVAKQAVTEVELSKILPVEELTDLPPLKDKTKIKGLSLFQTAHQEARSNGLIKFEFTNKAGETKVYLTGLKEPEEVLVAKQAVTEVELSKILPVEELTDLPPLKDKTKIKGLSLFQTAHQEARSNGLIKFEFTNKAGETKVYLTGLKESEEVLVAKQAVTEVELSKILPVEELTDLLPLESLSSSPAKKLVNIKLQKATPLNNFQKAYVDALVQGQKLFEYTNAKGKTAVYKTDAKGFKLAGFVENPIDNNQELNTQESAEPESLRDPFASPGDAKAPKINRSSSGEESKNQYYLSGVMASEHLELCVIITPLGESKIYHIGDKLTDKIKITGISDNAILINNSTKNIVIGDEVR